MKISILMILMKIVFFNICKKNNKNVKSSHFLKFMTHMGIQNVLIFGKFIDWFFLYNQNFEKGVHEQPRSFRT